MMKFRQWLSKVMYGRYGADEFNQFLSLFSVAMIILSMIIGGKIGTFFWFIAIAALVFQFFRIFSKKFDKRRAENRFYLQIKNPVKSYIIGFIIRLRQRKQYRFFRCKKCGAYMRVPRGKGKVRIRCAKCSTEFTAKA